MGDTDSEVSEAEGDDAPEPQVARQVPPDGATTISDGSFYPPHIAGGPGRVRRLGNDKMGQG